MGYEIVQAPLMLQETVAMLFKYINGISFKESLTQKKFLSGDNISESFSRRMGGLHEIMEKACADIDTQDPRFLRFFERVDSAEFDVCVASLMTYSFIHIDFPDLRQCAEQICTNWENAQKTGKWLMPEAVFTLMLADGPGGPGDLFEQVCGLTYPSEFKLKLYGVLRNFRSSMEELVELIEPYAKRLEESYRKEAWLLEETRQHFRDIFATTPPRALAQSIWGQDVLGDTAAKTFVVLLLMGSNFVAHGLDTRYEEPYNLLILGSGVTADSHLSRRSNDLDRVSMLLKTIGDRKRLEILCRLSKERSYCHELASAMEMDPGNMSRNLTLLNNSGFLRQKRESMINYYETDKDALREFLQLVESVVTL
ncbi:MAG: winged helix-turn-helix transcriptional regulator [Oscillospiraceae bacterium]|nr:winged helix-turn-helix transcriptional regulator [Oscillospiraceae bacterium]